MMPTWRIPLLPKPTLKWTLGTRIAALTTTILPGEERLRATAWALHQESSASARTYQPGSVAQARYDDDSSYGTVPEPAVLRILDASPLPGESPEELDTASSSDAPRRPPTNNSRGVSTTGSQIQLNPMPVNDVTQFTSNPEPGDLKDIAQLPAVPSHVRDRIERVQAADLPSNSTGIPPAVAPERDRATTRSMSSSAMPSAGAGGWRVR
jgi:hypothetical protein